MPITGLPQSARRRVYKRIVDQLITDPVLNNVVKSWTTGIADHAQRYKPNAMTETSITLTPSLGPGRRHSPDSFLFPLTINIEMCVPGTAAGNPDMLDAMDLWEAIETAIYPYNDRTKELAFEGCLVELGAETGQVDFSPSAFAGAGEKGQAFFTGAMTINIIRTLAP